MLRADIKLILLVLSILLLQGCNRSEPRIKIGDPLPRVTLTGLDGKSVALPDDFRGNLSVVLFWEKGCPYCAEEMPLAEGLYRKYRARGFTFLAVNVGGGREEIAEAVSGMGITYPVLLDPGSATVRKFGIRGVPTMFFVDREGRVTEKILGGVKTSTLDAMVAERL